MVRGFERRLHPPPHLPPVPCSSSSRSSLIQQLIRKHRALTNGSLDSLLIPGTTHVVHERLIQVLQLANLDFPPIDLRTHNDLSPVKATEKAKPIRLQRAQSGLAHSFKCLFSCSSSLTYASQRPFALFVLR